MNTDTGRQPIELATYLKTQRKGKRGPVLEEFLARKAPRFSLFCTMGMWTVSKEGAGEGVITRGCDMGHEEQKALTPIYVDMHTCGI